MAAAQRLSLVHLTQPPRAPSSGPPPLLLLLHGVGSHEGDLIGLAPYLDGRFYIVSARILPEILAKAAPPDAMRGFPILIVHGTEDPILPIHHGRTARDLLSALPIALTYREFPMGHTVSEESLAVVAAWLRDRLEEPPWTQRLRREAPGTT